MQEQRIKKDIELFEQHVQDIPYNPVVEMANRYYHDTKYYLDKKDLFTAFGCINYAHGLLDALRLNQEDK